jgi:hypothetical protein
MTEYLSPEALFSRAKACDGLPIDSGTTLDVALRVLETVGQCYESEWPYHGMEPAVPTTLFVCGTGERATKLLVDFARESVAAGRPVVAGLELTLPWFDGGTRVPDPPEHGQGLGGHAVLIVGYDDDEGYVIIRNSWGPAWGQLGYAELPYSHIERFGWEMASVELATP